MKHYVKNYWRLYTLRSTNSLLLKMAIEMVGLPIKNGDLLYSYVSYLQLIYPLKMDKHGDFPWFFLCLPEGIASGNDCYHWKVI